MKFSWKWLNDLIDIKDLSLNEITTKLILAGFEIENIINKPEIQDKTIDISITANRSDASCMIGLAREISVLFKLKSLKHYDDSHIDIINKSAINLKNNYLHNIKSNAILNFQINTITDLQQNTSPIWLKNYLKACDVEPTNILSDILEYIKIKWGQDIEIYDLDKINNNYDDDARINIEKLSKQEKWMNIIDSYNFKSDESVELLKYNNQYLSIIGIKSNPKFQCDSNTSSIIVIGKTCNQIYLNQITQIIKNKPEKLKRHLKYTSTTDLINGYNETVQLILYLTNGNFSKLYNLYKNNNNLETIIHIDKKQITSTLGPLNENNEPLSDITILAILKQLNFQPEHKNNIFKVKIPQYRQQDITESIDIIEEIGRVYGFEKFLDKLPPYNNKGYISNHVKYIKKIRDILSSFGLYEIINYSLENSIIKHESTIKLHNTLLEDQSQLKDNLIKDLILTKKYNIKQKNLFLESFEIGRVFHKQKISIYNNQSEYIETLNIAGVLGNVNFSKKSWKEKSNSMTWFEAKGIIEDFLEKMNTNIIWIKPENKQDSINNSYWCSICHPNRTAILCNQQTKEKIGIFSELNTKQNKAINSNHRTYIFELNLFHLIKAIKKIGHLSHIYKPYSSYPSITRDISLKLNKNKTATTIKDSILHLNNPLIKSVNIFNEYNNNNSHKYRNVGFRITYQSEKKTLSDQDIDYIHSKITSLLESVANHNN